jgi:hypothetical protein
MPTKQPALPPLTAAEIKGARLVLQFIVEDVTQSFQEMEQEYANTTTPEGTLPSPNNRRAYRDYLTSKLPSYLAWCVDELGQMQPTAD